MSKSDSGREPMDPSIREDAVPSPVVRNPRPCWAAKTLVAEVEELFPETPFEYSEYNQLNTALDVQFDLSVLDTFDNQMLVDLLTMLPTPPDGRIRGIVTDYDEQSVLVEFRADARTQDDRSPFGLADALLILSDLDEDGTP